MIYPVNEIFESIQFEGGRSGTRNIFIRLAGCNMSCQFCDTNTAFFEELFVSEILERCSEFECKNVVITGGEPMIHDLTLLLAALKGEGYYIAMESNGSLLENLYEDNRIDLVDWLTVSPKEQVDRMYLELAHETKYVVPDHETLIWWGHQKIFLQPEWNKKASLARCLELQREKDFMGSVKLSVQTHKYLDLR